MSGKAMLQVRMPWAWCIALLSGGALLVTGGNAFAQEADLKVDVCGIRVVQPPYGGDFEMTVLQGNGGSSIALCVSRADGGLIDYVNDDSKLESFTDDQGTNLLAGEDNMGMVGLSGWCSISKDGKAATIEIHGPSLPKQGATALHAKGMLAFQIAKEKKAFTSPAIKLEIDAPIEAGPVPFTVKSMGKPDWGNEPLEISLATNTDDSAIAEIKFMDANGEVIESSQSSSSRMSFGDQVQIERSYTLTKKLEQIKVEITYWMDMKKVATPFDVTAKVGL